MFSQADGRPTQKVRIRFTSFYAQSIREQYWHSTQRFVEQADGSVVLEMELAEFSLVSRWVLGFGRYAEVLQPPELRDMVLEELQMTSGHYTVAGMGGRLRPLSNRGLVGPLPN